MTKSILIITALLLFTIHPVRAHDFIHSFQKLDGERILMVYYNTEVFQAGIPTTFTVRLYNLSDGRTLPFEKVRLDFGQNNELEKEIEVTPNENQEASTEYGFVKSGEYQLGIALLENGKTIKTNFPLLVKEGAGRKNISQLPTKEMLISFIFGIATMAIILEVFWGHKKYMPPIHQ